MLMQVDEAKLEFAYRYPFSDEAKVVISSLNADKLEQKYIDAGIARVKEALTDGSIPFTEQSRSEMKLVYTISYVYSRMIVSALGSDPVNSHVILKYAIAEARRAGEAVDQDKRSNIDRLAREFGIEFALKGDVYEVPFYKYVAFEPKGNKEYSLLHQQLEKGNVYLTKNKMVRLFEEAAKRAILKGLPIERKYLPKEIVVASQKIPVPKPVIKAGAGGAGFEWIEKLLEIPLPDFRHRAVNLILAPYFANVKNMTEEQAVAATMDYINKCKALNPQTDITEAYVKYQVSYAKKKGLKPYSLSRVKSLIGDVIDLGTVDEKPKEGEKKKEDEKK